MWYDALIYSKSTGSLFIAEYGECFYESMCILGPPTKATLKDLGRYETVAAIGGGAVIDAAKMVGNKVFCWPTTASGASATSHSVYWDGDKKCNCHRTPPEGVHWHEGFINSLPEEVYQRTKYDAISHCLDAMWSKNCTAEVRSLAIETLDILLRTSVDRMEVMKAGHTAGYIIEKVPTTILHALSYPMTGIYNIPHGTALGILLKPVCEMMDEPNLAERIEPIFHEYTYDVSTVVEAAKEYSKFHNTTKQIDTDRLKELIFVHAN
jgi:alcohol dehydrogenase class IV